MSDKDYNKNGEENGDRKRPSFFYSKNPDEIKYGGYTLEQMLDLDLEELAPIALRSSYVTLSGISPTSKLSPPLMIYIFKIIEKGLTFEDAGTLAGISRQTIYRWRQNGRRIEKGLLMGEIVENDITIQERYAYLFYGGIERAIVSRKLRLLGKIEEAANADPRNWPAFAWLLERTHPEDYGQRFRIEQVDWRSKLIDHIKDGLEFGVLVDDIGEGQARELFESAGITIDAPRISAGDSQENPTTPAPDSEQDL